MIRNYNALVRRKYSFDQNRKFTDPHNVSYVRANPTLVKRQLLLAQSWQMLLNII